MSKDTGWGHRVFGEAALNAMLNGTAYIKITYDKDKGLMSFSYVEDIADE